MTLRRHQKALMAATAVSTLLLTAACGGTDDADTAPPAATSEPAAETEGDGASTGEASGDYADGSYEASGSYTNPGGTSSVAVELTLAGGVVEDVTVTPEASGTSRQYQEQFAGGIADEVVGVSIDDLDVSRVAGSSLTSQGFNEAVEQIKADASA